MKSHSSKPIIASIANQFSAGIQANVNRVLEKYAKEDAVEKDVNQLRKELKDVAKQNKDLLEKVTKLELLMVKSPVSTTTDNK